MLKTGRVRVLIADDHELVRRGLRLVLAAENDIEVVGEASDGQHALLETQRLHPDILLLDLRMPGMDGVETCARVREACPETCVVILTSFDDEVDVMTALRAGASSYILKDVSPAALAQSLRAAGNGNRALRPPLRDNLIAGHGHRREVEAESPLSARELEVLQLMAAGLKNREIAQAMWISENTVKTHVAHVIGKLGQRDRTQAVVIAIRRGLIDVDAEPYPKSG